MTYDVRIEQHVGLPLAVVRRRATPPELATVVPEACGTVWSVIRSQQVPGAGRHIAVYWDCEINLEVGVELEAPFAGHGEVIGSSTPSGRVVTTTHFGPYQLLRHAHQAIQDYCTAHNLRLAGPSWEIYGHWTDEYDRDPGKIRTDIYYLLADS